jgi:hypothetical protein
MILSIQRSNQHLAPFVLFDPSRSIRRYISPGVPEINWYSGIVQAQTIEIASITLFSFNKSSVGLQTPPVLLKKNKI